MNHLLLVVGARPNFMKAAPILRACAARDIRVTLVHTGQHYDPRMSDVFFSELNIPHPDINLEVGAGDRITQSAKIIQALVSVLQDLKPNACAVVGDVTSSAAGALAAVQAGIPAIHIEAGLRSFNWAMPEELNRMIADHYSQHLFVTEPIALENLKNERIDVSRAHLVGNVMIDTLQALLPKTESCNVLTRLNLKPQSYGLLTLHRPENVDDPAVLASLWKTLCEVSEDIPLVFPVHPRTRFRLEALGESPSTIQLIEPVGYIDMLTLTKYARLALTDSGGLQEETTVLGIPCLTLREQTERPITVEVGTSEIMGRDAQKIRDGIACVLAGNWKKGNIPDLWDGHTAERIVDILKKM